MSYRYYILFCLITIIFLYKIIDNKNNLSNIPNIEDLEKCNIKLTSLNRPLINSCISSTTPSDFLLSNTQVTNVKNSLLSWAVIFNCYHTFLYLIENGADINNGCYTDSPLGGYQLFESKKISQGYTPLYYAIVLKRHNYIQPLLNSGASLEYKNGYYINDILHHTESYFDLAIYTNNYKGFCQLYRYINSPSPVNEKSKEYYKKNLLNILDRAGIDFQLSFYQSCRITSDGQLNKN